MGQEQNPSTPEKNPAKNHKAVIISAIAVVSILVLAGIIFAVWSYQKKAQKTAVQPSVESNAQQQNVPAISQSVTSVTKYNKDDFVEWYPAPKEIPAPKIYKEDDRKYTAWEVGKFIVGEDKDKTIVFVMGASEGPGGPDIWRFIKGSQENPNELLLLYRYSLNTPPVNLNEEDISLDVNTDAYKGNTRINSLEYPGVLYTPKGERMLKDYEFPYESIWHENTQSYEENIFFKTDLLKKAFTDPVYGDFYTTDRTKINENNSGSIYAKNGFYVKAPDGTFRIYSLAIDFVDNNDVPNIIWNSGAKNALKYTFQGEKGCGAGMFNLVVDEKFPLSDLTETGKTAIGLPVFELRDKNNKFIKDYYDALKNMDDYFFEGKSFKKDITYEQFLAAHPIFFWKDTFGRLILFLSTDYINTESPGCGKPVIYLYPEKTQKVSVKVMPSGGFTKTEPDYGSGWNVIADPMSRIKNLADGKTYSYLFWEGKSNAMYQMSNFGFVAGLDGLENLLNEKLSLLGLNQKEIADFKEFWLSKMLSENKPYYFVTFVPQRKIDEIAPLEINPQPDTVIRVLMDYKGLDQKIVAPEYEIKTPERKGFTAVEWGGMLK
jgi:hypothetical protein